MGKELTIAQLTFVDLYDSYTLSLSSDVIAVPCNPDGEALNTKTYEIKYSIRAGEKMIAATCESTELSSNISGITITPSDSSESVEGTISVKVNATTEIPEDSGINISVKTKDSNEFAFNRFISFMNIKKGQDGDFGRGISSITEEYEISAKSDTAPTSGWEAKVKAPTEDKPYLWNRELITYNKADDDGNTQSYTTPRIISIYGKDGDPGRGIESIVEYYAASSSSEYPGTSVQLLGGAKGTVSIDQTSKSNGVSDVVLDENTRYYTINMNQQSNSYSIVRLTFNITQATDITIKCINNGESTYDYMVISHISTNDSAYRFSDVYDADESTNTFYSFSGTGKHSENPVDIVFSNVASGTHYVYIKVRKDHSVNNADTYKFQCDELVADWQTSVPDDYGPDHPYLWNYTCFNYTDGGSDSSDPQVISHWGVDGEPAFALKVVPDKGDVFKEGIEEITLSLEAYEGENKINVQVPYVWKYYTFDSSDGDGWITLSSGTANIEDISLTVRNSDEYAYSMFRCEITYNGEPYSDYETLKKDAHDIYHAEMEILDDGKSDTGQYAILYTKLYKNGKEVDPLKTYNVCYLRSGHYSFSSSYNKQKVITSSDIDISNPSPGDYAYFILQSKAYYNYVGRAGELSGNNADFQYRYENGSFVDCNSTSGLSSNTHLYAENFGCQIILCKYTSNYEWEMCDPNYEYSYENSVYENVTLQYSKILLLNKINFPSDLNLIVTVREKAIEDDNLNPSYPPFLCYTRGLETTTTSFPVTSDYGVQIKQNAKGEDVYLIDYNSLLYQVIKTSYIEECFSRDAGGVYVNQLVTEIDSDGKLVETKPFYVKITSQKMSFGAREYNTDKTAVTKDTEMVYIGNNATNITNSVLEGNTTINGNVTISNTAKHATSKFGIQMENNGSISLVLA